MCQIASMAVAKGVPLVLLLPLRFVQFEYRVSRLGSVPDTTRRTRRGVAQAFRSGAEQGLARW